MIKKNLIILSVLFALVIPFVSQAATAVIYIHVKEGGSRTWNEVKESCPKKGETCIKERKEIPLQQGNVSKNGNQYTLIGVARDAEFTVQLLGTPSFTFIEPAANDIFEYDDVLIIQDCAEYPELNGKEIPLEGIPIDANAQYIVTFTL